MTVPGLVRLRDLEERLDELVQVVTAQNRIIGALVRFADPTSVQLSREDRDAIVAYAKASEDAGPGRTPDSPKA